MFLIVAEEQLLLDKNAHPATEAYVLQTRSDLKTRQYKGLKKLQQ